jgi:Short C-terminal domain
MVGGGAYVAGKHRARAQDEQAADAAEQDERISSLEAQQPEATAPAAAPASSGGLSDDAITKLKQISDLHASGVLTDEEFAQQKERLLA